MAYNRIGDYSNALSFYERAFKLRKKIFHSNHPELAHSNNNLGLLYKQKGDLSTARSFLEKAFEIRQKHLPPNHPGLANSYGCLGSIRSNIEDHSKLIPIIECTIDIEKL